MNDTIGWQPLLRDALAALAAPADEQNRVVGRGCIACELLEDFDNARRVALGSAPLSDVQRAILDQIDDRMVSMRQADSECWDNDVVRRPAWRDLRGLAEQALREFGWEGARPRAFVEIRPGLWHRPPSET